MVTIKKHIGVTIIILVFLVILISILDIAMNFVGTIPILGDIIETLSETVLESLQILITAGIGLIAYKEKG